MQVQLRKLSSIKPYKSNPRLNEKAVEAVARSEVSKSRSIAIWSLSSRSSGSGSPWAMSKRTLLASGRNITASMLAGLLAGAVPGYSRYAAVPAGLKP